jgi:hypothetical protein
VAWSSSHPSSTVLGPLGSSPLCGSRPQVSSGRYTGGCETPITELTCADSNFWACGAVVARVAYNDKPAPYSFKR